MPFQEEVLNKLLQDIAAIKAATVPQISGLDFFSEANNHILSLKNQQRLKSAECYRRSLRAFGAFLGAQSLPFESVKPSLLRAFFDHLTSRVSTNTAKAYLVDLRVLYNHIASLHDFGENPFRKLDLARHSGRGLRALTAAQLSRIAALDGLAAPLQIARDMFLLSFALRA